MWNLLPSERLRCWQEFRRNLNKLSVEQALKETTHLWAYAPFVTRFLNDSNVDEWPDPWELLYKNNYCDLAKVLGMLYTLYLSEHKSSLAMEIRIYKGELDHYNLLWINQGKYVLNLEHDTIVNKEHLDNNIKLLKIISVDQLKLEQY
jgi:hypothetical protein